MNVNRTKLRGLSTLSLYCETEDSPYHGHFQHEDGSNDDELCDWIREQLQMDNRWAWCHVRVTVEYAGLEGQDTLGGCSYESKASFMSGGYYEDMIEMALSELAAKLEAIGNEHDLWEHDGELCFWCIAATSEAA